jgi:hypothetical protein
MRDDGQRELVVGRRGEFSRVHGDMRECRTSTAPENQIGAFPAVVLRELGRDARERFQFPSGRKSIDAWSRANTLQADA